MKVISRSETFMLEGGKNVCHERFCGKENEDLKKCNLIEQQDFASFAKIGKREKGATIRQDYLLSVDAARHIAMLERSEKRIDNGQPVLYN